MRESLARLPDGAKLAYARHGPAGDGRVPLLLCRPLGGSMALWGDFASRLAAHAPVVAFDPRGVGRSSDVPAGHTTRAMAADALALLDVLGVARAHVFGVSLGGMVASWLAVDGRERVDRLVLASTIPEALDLSWHALGRGVAFARCFLRRGVEAERCLVHRVLSSGFADAHPDTMAAIDRAVRAAPARRANLVRLAWAAARHQVPPPADRPAPTLLLFGERDPLAGEAARAALAADHPGARLEVLPGVGHDLTLEDPAGTAERVLAFLA